jgi:hypothetical protein
MKMAKILALGVVVLLGCATNREARLDKVREKGDPDHPLFVGHSDTGDVVMAASHYDAMSGVAVAAADVSQKNGEKLVCSRETLTGTHIPTWVCRYPKENDLDRVQTQNWLIESRTCTRAPCGP